MEKVNQSTDVFSQYKKALQLNSERDVWLMERDVCLSKMDGWLRKRDGWLGLRGMGV